VAVPHKVVQPYSNFMGNSLLLSDKGSDSVHYVFETCVCACVLNLKVNSYICQKFGTT
jgi:hypothetical protein